MTKHEKTINALSDIADFFRICRKNKDLNGVQANRLDIYIEALEDAVKRLKAMRVLTIAEEDGHDSDESDP